MAAGTVPFEEGEGHVRLPCTPVGVQCVLAGELESGFLRAGVSGLCLVGGSRCSFSGFPRAWRVNGSRPWQRAVGSWDTFPAVWQEASPAERTEQVGWAANPSCKAENECQAETCSPRFGSALSQLPEWHPVHLSSPPVRQALEAWASPHPDS